RPACFLGLLLLVQLMLGVGSYFGKFTSLLQLSEGMVVLLTTTHLAIGGLMFVTSLLLTLRSFRLSPLSKAPVKQPVLREGFSLCVFPPSPSLQLRRAFCAASLISSNWPSLASC